ncbi:MAG: hypothetical protein LAQ30_01695 [Acidobacteriia bacterium]|nr:hypothetical protein [Terriglobia bacterium]
MSPRLFDVGIAFACLCAAAIFMGVIAGVIDVIRHRHDDEEDGYGR